MIKPHIAEYLEKKGVPWIAHAHPRRFSAQETAAAEHVSGKRFAKTVVLEQDGRFVLAVLPAHLDVDTRRLEADIGRVRLAEERRFAGRFADCEVGAMPPLGELYGMEVVVDRTLVQQPSIVFNGGTHEDSVEMRTDDFLALAPARILDFGLPAWEHLRVRAS